MNSEVIVFLLVTTLLFVAIVSTYLSHRYQRRRVKSYREWVLVIGELEWCASDTIRRAMQQRVRSALVLTIIQGDIDQLLKDRLIEFRAAHNRWEYRLTALGRHKKRTLLQQAAQDETTLAA
jgi:hypothetical protein